MSLVQFKYAVDLDSENCMGDDVDYVNHQQAVYKICQRQVVVEPVDYADFLCREYRNFGQVKDDTYDCAQYKQKVVPHTFEFVIVFRETDCHFFQLLHHIVEL